MLKIYLVFNVADKKTIDKTHDGVIYSIIYLLKKKIDNLESVL